MGLALDILALPAMGPIRLVCWLAQTVGDQALREFLDEGPVRGELLELQQRLDAGELGEAEYDRQEKVLLERLSAIREFKASQVKH